MSSTARLYLHDGYLQECDSTVVGVDGSWWSLDQTVFYPGGGGQPPDTGFLTLEGKVHQVDTVRMDRGEIWHRVDAPSALGASVHCHLDWDRRYALMRHHALLHVVNTVALRAHGAMITGTLIGTQVSRIDFHFKEFSRSILPEFENEVNDVIGRSLPITSATVTEAEYRARPDLIRTRNVLPPVEEGPVRVVEIRGFDLQACGGTHVHNTGEIGSARIERFENKGRENKRFYWVLEDTPTSARPDGRLDAES